MKEKNNDDYFEKQNPSILRSIGGLLTFSTILPLNIYTTIDEMAKITWFWPIINGIIGLIATIIAFILIEYIHFDALLIATIVYGFLLIINGFNHFDGLMDFGDGIMVHGSPEKKLSTMKDPMTGVGGIVSGFIVGTITIASYCSLIDYAYAINLDLILLIIVAEISAKIGLTTCCISSNPSEDGIGKYFIKYMNFKNYVFGLIISFLISLLLSSTIGFQIGIMGIIGGAFGGALTSLIANKHLKIANGDVLGTSNELARLFSLLAMLIVISTSFTTLI
ncbi:adenosylcobinamide-GDP ribazoletransferase [Methanobrevibacter olleyae]|uniref:Adenosylcobinamide-GDP ribazoletransferase n=1 Tax=Methanobrevibacter olleyae TaxID=294671 RepID=A0A126R0K3_METOL|nr:adenosylcobinamide-GDP ribazoletransferase [Methanobrevibacter olleyae]AMK15900.1 cobalamin-5-phosphate synthase CobS [Methanobrevibacter olleyae]SFL14999.1 cobalamin-5'-phosphate synthase [Methanobrevibacter olleyae]